MTWTISILSLSQSELVPCLVIMWVLESKRNDRKTRPPWHLLEALLSFSSRCVDPKASGVNWVPPTVTISLLKLMVITDTEEHLKAIAGQESPEEPLFPLSQQGPVADLLRPSLSSTVRLKQLLSG